MPEARARGLIVRSVGDEVLVYDTDNNKVHCLNRAAALVWQECDGARTVADVATAVAVELEAQVDADLVWYALRQLERHDLLCTSATSVPIASMSRRDFAQKLGAVAAAIAVPTVIALSAPSAARAATCLPSGSACTSSAQCCSGLCSDGICA
jgi:hypothetical protein